MSWYMYFSRIFWQNYLLLSTPLMKFASNCVHISLTDEWPPFPRTHSHTQLRTHTSVNIGSFCECVCGLCFSFFFFSFFRQPDKAAWSFPHSEAYPRPSTRPPFLNVIILSWAFLYSGCYFISTFCVSLNVNDAFSAIYGRLNSLAVALHKYTTPVSTNNSLQAWKNSDFLYWSESLAIPNSCMFSPPRILIFRFPFVSALFQWIANKNDSHFYNPWECGKWAFQEKREQPSLALSVFLKVYF